MPPRSAPSVRHAVALGLVQGPAELLPISSSAHIALIPLLARRRFAELAPPAQRGLEVALHTGAAAALTRSLRRGELAADRSAISAIRWAGLVALSSLPPAGAGAAFAGLIERRLAGPRAIALGLAGGGLAMALADTRPASRKLAQTGTPDALALGLAQALALVPGVSRNGATLTAARARGFSRHDAQLLSWTIAPPVMLGAGALTAMRAARSREAAGAGAALCAGAAVAFCSTLASARVLGRSRLARAPLLPFCLYRWLLAALVLRRLRR